MPNFSILLKNTELKKEGIKMMDRFKGKSALITGASGGIGSACVMRFLEEGCKVLAADINPDTLKTLQAKCDKQYPEMCHTMICNVTKRDDVIAAVEKGWALFGTVDKLINVAGGSLPGCPTKLLEVTEERWDMIFDLNAKSTFFFCQEFIKRHLEKGTTGAVVNFASQAGIVPNEYARPHYAAAKGAVVTLTRHMSKEFAPQGFRINAVAPGYCASGERIRNLWKIRDEQGVSEKMLWNVAMHRLGEPWEEAAAVAFLASDDAGYITGEILNVCGGGF